MIIGVPREVKDWEGRVAMTPAGVRQATASGHTVLVETTAGEASAVTDGEYRAAGGEIVSTADEVWERAEMIVKVKEPIASEYAKLRKDLVLFTYLHLASSRALTDAVIGSGCVGIAYETVQLPDRSLPLLVPMSEVAGRLSVLDGNHYLSRAEQGRGTLLSGVPGVRPANVFILGAGIAGRNAAQMAHGVGANVTVTDIDANKLRYLDDIYHGKLTTVVSNMMVIDEYARQADLVIAAVLVPGAAAPRLVTEETVRNMKQGAVIVDIAIDQGGAVETIEPTTHSDPIRVKHGVVHYAVTNMPAAVPRTSTWALTNATLPYVVSIANRGWKKALGDDPALRAGLNCVGGACTCEGVAKTFGLDYTDPASVVK